MTSWPTGSVELLLKRQSWGHPPRWPPLPFLGPQSPWIPLPERGKGMQGPGIPWARGQEGMGLASGGVDPPVGDSLQGTAVAAGQPE